GDTETAGVEGRGPFPEAHREWAAEAGGADRRVRARHVVGLPDLWQRYDITGCVSPADPDYPGGKLSQCDAPPPAPYLTAYAPGGASFVGLMPPDSQLCLPCDSIACPDCTNECSFNQFPPADTAIFTNRNGWNFPVVIGNPVIR